MGGSPNTSPSQNSRYLGNFPPKVCKKKSTAYRCVLNNRVTGHVGFGPCGPKPNRSRCLKWALMVARTQGMVTIIHLSAAPNPRVGPLTVQWYLCQNCRRYLNNLAAQNTKSNYSYFMVMSSMTAQRSTRLWIKSWSHHLD